MTVGRLFGSRFATAPPSLLLFSANDFEAVPQ
jgi:hypothetical protein